MPVVNENDTVATTEIRYGDNDRLSARVASMMSADCLVLLSDVDGLYTAPPAQDPSATRLDVVTAITPEIEAMAGDAGSELSRGGMVTKIEAGADRAGRGLPHGDHRRARCCIRWRPSRPGAPCTWFLAPSDPVTARKRWIAGKLEPKGCVEIDAGAEKALASGKSLLPAGVIRVERQLRPRRCRGRSAPRDGRELGRGLVAYARDDAEPIVGKKSSEIEQILGHAGRAELVHRDDMVLEQGLTQRGRWRSCGWPAINIRQPPQPQRQRASRLQHSSGIQRNTAAFVQLLLTPNIVPSAFLTNRLARASSMLSIVNCGFMPSNLQEASTCSTMNLG